MHNNSNTLIMESESIITKYINMKNGCLNKTKPKRNLFGKPNKKLTDKLFFEHQMSSTKLMYNFLKQFEIVDEKENQRMDVSEEFLNKEFSNSSDCSSSDFEKCSFSSTSDNSLSNDSSLCSQENFNIMNNNNLVNISNEFSNKCDNIRNLIKSSTCNKQTLITGKFYIYEKWTFYLNNILKAV